MKKHPFKMPAGSTYGKLGNKHRVDIDIKSAAFAKFKSIIRDQLITMMAHKSYEWMMAKPRRRIVVEATDDGGFTIQFLEDGTEVTPDFVTGFPGPNPG